MAKISKSRVWDKVPEGNTMIFGHTHIPCNTVWDRWKKAPMPKPSSIHPVVLIPAYDAQTDK